MKKILLIILMLSLVAIPFRADAQSLEQLQKQQAELDRKIEANRSAISSKQREINSFEAAISSLEDEIKAAQRDIDYSNNKIDLTIKEINATQKDIEAKIKELEIQRANLNQTVKTFYEMGNPSTMELVVGSNTFSEVIDRAQYYESISEKLQDQINKITAIKTDLENKKSGLEKNKTDLQDQKNALITKQKNLDLQETQKNSMLNQSVAQKADYQATLNNLMREHSKISDAIYAFRRAQGGISYGSSEYPYSAIDVPDPWGFLTRECTSYVAWYLNVKEGKNWYNTQPGRGSAKYWNEIAQTLGWTVSSTPQVGAAISWKGPLFAGDQWGHVAIVEAVNPDGTIDISEYNWVSYSYSYRRSINPGAYGSYVYIY